MRLILERALFAPQPGREATELKNLITTAALEAIQPPVVQTDPPYIVGADNQESDAWLASCSPEEAPFVQTFLVDGKVRASGPRGVAAVDPRHVGTAHRPAWRFANAPEVRVERRAQSNWAALRLTLADAIELLREPLHLVLENDFNDLAFVCHLAGPTNGPVLRKLGAAAGRLQVHGGGGGAAKNWLRAQLEQPLTAEKWRRVLRAWVLFDQDAGDPDAREPSSDAEAMMKVCEQVHAAFAVGLSWVCLRRREIESYVPDLGLQQEAYGHAAVVQQVIAWRGVAATEPHAWAFDLKKGLSGDLKANVPKATRDAVKAKTTAPTAAILKPPFDALGAPEVTALAYGLGDKLLNNALTRSPPAPWTADIPTEYDRGPAHQAPRLDLIQSLLDRI